MWLEGFQMKRVLMGALAALLSFSAVATTVPVPLLNPVGSTAGQAIVSTGATTAPAWGNVTATGLTAQAANTIVANVTGSSASPTAFAMPSCSTSTSALQWTSGTGFTCYASSATTTSTLAQFAATTSAQLAGVLSDETGTGAAVFATGAAINPTSTGATTPGTGAFTTLKGSSLAKVYATKTSAQSLANGAATTVTSWTTGFDANSNFTASTGTFTAPATGYYLISCQIVTAAVSIPANTLFSVNIISNAVVVAAGQSTFPTVSGANTAMQAQASVVASIAAGQTVTISIFHNEGAAINTSTGSGANYLSIVQLP